jgi:hypothetical protein
VTSIQINGYRTIKARAASRMVIMIFPAFFR